MEERCLGAEPTHTEMPTLTWIGKDKVINHHQEVPYCTLEEQYQYGDANTGNKIIHGDNLLALKALLPQYEGRIKCIYIDPPYNTGNENWVYNDNVNSPQIKKWLGEVVGKEGEDLSRHDKWLCMMYPRLQLLQKLLAEDGAIFISIDDNEQANLKLLCNEILGTRNFVGQILVKRQGGRQDSKHFAVVHEYCVCYAKNLFSFQAGNDIKENSVYPKYDKERKKYYKTQLLRKWGSNSLRENRPNLYYPILAPDGSEVYPTIYQKKATNDLQFDKIEGRWRWSANNLANAMQEGRVEFIKDANGNWIPYEKIFAPDEGETETKKFTTWQEQTGNGTNQLKLLFGNAPFDYPKSIDLIEVFLTMANINKDGIILDSFAGSGTTAHAVLNLNKKDGGNRKFILVEMEDYAETLTAERVRRVINGYGEGKNETPGTGGGFTYYELGEPLMRGGYINENQPVEKIQEYIWYTETRTPFVSQRNKYYLGKSQNAGYYFYYEKNKITTLGYDTLNIVKERADQYIIYADQCLIGEDDLRAKNILFKKIPRDIRRF